MTWHDLNWLDSWQGPWHKTENNLYIYIQYIQLQSTYLKTSYIPQDTERCLFWVSDWGLLGFVARVVVFCAWAYTLGRAFLSGTAAGGGGAGGAGGGADSGEVCPTHWLGLGALWLLLLRTLIHRVFFWATRGWIVFLFWPDWFPWLSKAGNDFICIFSAEWYTDTSKPAGAVFYSLAHWTIVFWFWYIWHGSWYDWPIDLSNQTGSFMPEVLVSTHEIHKFSKATCWHVMDAHIPYHNSWVLSFPYTHNRDALVSWNQLDSALKGI